MKHYVVHDPVKVIRTGTCDDDQVLQQATEPDQTVVETEQRYHPDNLSVVDGELVLPS
jgi:hypothetical protein